MEECDKLLILSLAITIFCKSFNLAFKRCSFPFRKIYINRININLQNFCYAKWILNYRMYNTLLWEYK